MDLLGSQQRDHCSTSRDLVMFSFSLFVYLTCDAEGRITKRKCFSSSGNAENFLYMEGISGIILSNFALNLC